MKTKKRNINPRIAAILSIVAAGVLIFTLFNSPEVMAQGFDADRELIMPEVLINHMSEEESGLSQPEEPGSTSKLLALDEIARTYHRQPLHPYFRDEYQVVTDLRRLVKFVDKRKVKGFESVAELVNIGSDLPLERQTAIVSTALAGSAANILSGMANKQLRRWKVSYIQWETERVAFRTRYRDILIAAIYKGISSDGIQVFFPFAGIHYSYYLKELSQLHRFTYWLTKKWVSVMQSEAPEKSTQGSFLPSEDVI